MSQIFEFDFDEWVALARRDPEAFDRRRDQVVNETCERLRVGSGAAISQICWRIDIERQRCTTPMQLCLKLSSLMWDRYFDMNDGLNDLLQHMGQNTSHAMLKQRSAKLLAFPSNQQHGINTCRS